MDVLGGFGSCGGLWWRHSFNHIRRRRDGSHSKQKNASSESAHAHASDGGSMESGYRFSIQQAITAGSLALTGDNIAQIRHRWTTLSNDQNDLVKDILQTLLSGHDWLRSLRMTSYGFLSYGPGSYVWYQTPGSQFASTNS